MLLYDSVQRRLGSALSELSAECKRRHPDIKALCEDAQHIVESCKSFEELKSNEDLIKPITAACSTGSNKLVSSALHCLQQFAGEPCIDASRLPPIIECLERGATMGSDLQLRVLQVVPVFFKTYRCELVGQLCARILTCCASLLHPQTRSAVVEGGASATLQQIVGEIFDRLEDTSSPKISQDYEVLISNSESVKVNVYRKDANCVLSELCLLIDGSKANLETEGHSYFNLKEMNIEYGLEILESILMNNMNIFMSHEDLKFILKTRVIPLCIKCISTSKQFSVINGSCRCIALLVNTQVFKLFDMELEFILSLLIRNIPFDSTPLSFQRVLALELFQDIAKKPELIYTIFVTFDDVSSRKSIINNLLDACMKNIKSGVLENILGVEESMATTESPILTHEKYEQSPRFLSIMDKSTPPNVNLMYVTWMIIQIVNSISESLSILSTKGSQDKDIKQQNVSTMVTHIVPQLMEIYEVLLYSVNLDKHGFNSIVRALQKAIYSAGCLAVDDKLEDGLMLFAKAILESNVEKDKAPHHTTQSHRRTPSISGGTSVLSALSETIIGEAQSTTHTELSSKRRMHSRSLNYKHVSLFRAMISIVLTLGPNLQKIHWKVFVLSWQWFSYFLYGPSTDFMERYYDSDIPQMPQISRNDVNSIVTSIAQLYENTKSYTMKSFNVLLAQLIAESQISLSQAIPTKQNQTYMDYIPFDKSGNLNCCTYNKGFYLIQLGKLATSNSSRFLVSEEGTASFKTLMDYLISLISSRTLPSTSLRMYTVTILTDIIKSISFDIDKIQDMSTKMSKFRNWELLFPSIIMDVIRSIKSLPIDKPELYQGNITIEADIVLQMIYTVKELLNDFGDLLTESWSIVFQIINSPFEWAQDELSLPQDDNREDFSLLDNTIQKHVALIQASYEVFKLISDDFMQQLPLSVIEAVIKTLTNFATQQSNLNISFASISQFWLIGDYLRTRYTNALRSELELNNEGYRSKIRDDNLLIIIQTSTREYEVYFSLWLYLLKSIIDCSQDKRTEVQNGAMQTFFGIIDSQSACFPDWTIIYMEVIKPLLTFERNEADISQNVEIINITLKGLVGLYPLYYTEFSEEHEHLKAWSSLLEFVQILLNFKSASITYVGLTNFQQIMRMMSRIDNLPPVLMDKCSDMWTNYKVVYSDIAQSTNYSTKSEYDCILILINSFEDLYKLINNITYDTEQFLERVIGVLNFAAKYPILPDLSQDRTRPSTLQQAVLDKLALLDHMSSKKSKILLCSQYSILASLSVETTSKIKRKLEKKLSKGSLSRIPTFEALSYRACQKLTRKISQLNPDDIQPSFGQYAMKTMKNLFQIVKKKEQTNLDKIPLWLMALQNFRHTSLTLLEAFSRNPEDFDIIYDFCTLFVDASVTLLDPISPEIDKITEHEDASEYEQMTNILLTNKYIQLFPEPSLLSFLERTWQRSSIFEPSELEISMFTNKSVPELLNLITSEDNTYFFGSTNEKVLQSKVSCSLLCVKNLVKFAVLDEPHLADFKFLSLQFFITKLALTLTKYNADKILSCNKPTPKLAKVEITLLLQGLEKLIDDDAMLVNSRGKMGTLELSHIQPILLKTITPASGKDDLPYRFSALALRLGEFIKSQ